MAWSEARRISYTVSEVISHARLFLFFTEHPWNPWKMLAEPLGFAEPRLKITGLSVMVVGRADRD